MARGISSLTPVQAAVLEPGLLGRDVLARANTGSGKTLAFLLVAIERILKKGGPDPTSSFPVVILTPVTDLATQIFKVAAQLLAYHAPMKADLVIGGTDEARDIRRLSGSNRIDVLVATPGRFKSLITQSPAISNRLKGCQTFVIDEADKLTDPGFLRDTQRIHSVAKHAGMQTLMFSATMDKPAIMRTGLLGADVHVVDILSHDKSVVNTSVMQNVIVAQPADWMSVLQSIVHDQQLLHSGQAVQTGGSSDVASLGFSAGTTKALREWEIKAMTGYRIMCFLPSNTFIDYFSDSFRTSMPSATTMVLHGGLAQNKRTKMSDAFRTTGNCILFTSDASARGVDYADVTCVVQFGYDSRAEYLQRVGRTGRAGKSGTAFLIVAPQEAPGVSQICDVVNRVYANGSDGIGCGVPTRKYSIDNHRKIRTDGTGAKRAFSGWLGSLASKWKRLKIPKADVLSFAQDMATAIGLGRQDADRLKEKLHL